ncbi:putative recQ-mediated genome instability protein [Helianthus annuus]|nr:putative recQ-mediated genome instability protein [Helianthus annuus]
MSSRRRLRIICSSDEEDDDDDIQQPQPPLQQQHDDIESETPNPSLSNPNNPPHPIQIELSDEEFIDATEDSPNSPPLPSSPPPQHHQPVYTSEYSTTSTVGTNQASDSPIGRVLGELGLRLKGEWLDSCLRGLETAVPGFSSLDATQKAKLCFDKFLNADMNYCGAGSLPNNVHQMHLVDLPGPFVLQVDEIVNISQHLRERYKKANAGLKRCLKLSMTDGVQRVFGMEYQPIKDLDVLAPAGLKVAISNVTVRHGLIMLVPEVFQVLGGIVEELDAARQRVVTEVNKPPRGRRTRTGVVPPLATRATRAAWPANGPVSQSTAPMQGDNTVPVNGRASSNSAVPVNGRASSNPAVPVSVRGSSNPAVPGDCRASSNPAVPVSVRASSNSAVHLSVRASSNSAVHLSVRASSNSSIPISGRMSNSAVPVSGRVPNFAVPNEHQPPRTGVESSVSAHRMNPEPFPSTAATENSVNMNSENATFTVPIIRETVETTPFRVREETTAPVHLASPVAFSDDDEDVHLVATSREKPFTYLAQLSVKWAESKDKSSHVEGKIKCFVTGVKVFQYKKRSTYELQVYVDDGSLISEILIDHNGIMVVRINGASSLPVAIEMQQGCSLSDAWSLLGRLKSSNDDQRSHLDPIILSP